jgi:hypothetical protein
MFFYDFEKQIEREGTYNGKLDTILKKGYLESRT